MNVKLLTALKIIIVFTVLRISITIQHLCLGVGRGSLKVQGDDNTGYNYTKMDEKEELWKNVTMDEGSNPNSNSNSNSNSGYVTPPTQVARHVPIQPPPRPRRVFNINNASPVSTPSPVVHQSSQLVKNDNNKDIFTVLTWNVWFDYHKQSIRYKEIVKNVLTLDPDVACFQEVTRPFLNALKSNQDLIRRYHISSNPIYNYGIISIAKKDIGEMSFEEITLPSNMGRSLLMTHININRLSTEEGQGNDGAKDDMAFHLVVGNVHLESLDNEQLRREQLITSHDHLKGYSASLLVGDFNFDSEQTWGDWNKAISLNSPKHKLENRVLQEVMPEWTDAWPYIRGIGKDSDPGITFDGLTNSVCVPNKEERMRYDRIMVHMPSTDPHGGLIHLVPDEIKMIGMDQIDATGLKASDHYGLWIKLNIESFDLTEDAKG